MTEQHETQHHPKANLDRDGIGVLVGTALAPLIEGILLFSAAGTIALPRAWLFLALAFVGMFGQIALVAAVNPELVNRRGRWKQRKDTKPWDKALLKAYGLLGFFALPIVIGLDIGRYHWSNLGVWSTIAGIALFAFGTLVITWAMLVNTHFEITVRIQHDRDHKVIASGPYAFVRHPGYVGASLWALATPLIVGSAFGLIPASLAVAMLVARTIQEDAMLRRELTGYADYAARVHWRLVPCIW
jgi:protein-S-isoprenylcysteine O-methyltransferase Ste14